MKLILSSFFFNIKRKRRKKNSHLYINKKYMSTIYNTNYILDFDLS